MQSKGWKQSVRKTMWPLGGNRNKSGKRSSGQSKLLQGIFKRVPTTTGANRERTPSTTGAEELED